MTSPLSILFADEHLVVVGKPSGLLVHRGGWGDDDVVAMTLARDLVGRHVYPVHRLDRATSGALVFALNPAIARILHEGFEAGADRQMLSRPGARRGPRGLRRGPRHPAPRGRPARAGLHALPPPLRPRALFGGGGAAPHRASSPGAPPFEAREPPHHRRRELRQGRAQSSLPRALGPPPPGAPRAVARIRAPGDRRAMRVDAPMPEDLAGPLRALGVPEAIWSENRPGIPLPA